MSNLRQQYGMAFSQPGKSMQDGEWMYDSRKPKWTVELDSEDPHLKIFEVDGGTKWSLTTDPPQYREEVLFRVRHKMPYPPAFVCFINVIDVPPESPISIGRYSYNVCPVYYTGQATEGIFARVDEEFFSIIHFAETYPLGSDTINFFGSDFKFRIRYEILNQKALYLGPKPYI